MTEIAKKLQNSIEKAEQAAYVISSELDKKVDFLMKHGFKRISSERYVRPFNIGYKTILHIYVDFKQNKIEFSGKKESIDEQDSIEVIVSKIDKVISEYCKEIIDDISGI